MPVVSYGGYMPGALRSTVIVPVPEAAEVVDPWRERTCNDKPSIGVPAHVTLVFPFVPAERLEQGVIASLAEIVGGERAFGFALRVPARFPTTLYLAPEPALPFVRLTEAIVRRFPEHPPYEGAFDTIVPHLAVAEGDGALMDEAEADVARNLPIVSVAREALLLEEVEPDWGRWQVRARLPMG
jgi:2'-5' RNA ligase